MFDILVYLFETYAHPASFPDSPALARKLSAVGFETDDISAALEWLAALEHRSERNKPLQLPADAHAIRVYGAREQTRLPVECQGFLHFLEQAEVIDASLREMIIERALALNVACISLRRLKIIVLMVLWRHYPTIDSVDTLLLDELLSSEDSTPCFH
jgi:Smg protein